MSIDSFQGRAQERVLNLGLQYLVEDLRRGAASYLREVESSPTKRAAFLKKHREIARPTFEDRH